MKVGTADKEADQGREGTLILAYPALRECERERGRGLPAFGPEIANNQ